MKKLIPCLLIVCLLTGCSFLLPETQTDETAAPTFPPTETIIPTDEPLTEALTEAPTEAPTEPEEEHSELYIPGVSVEDVITYFNEVCLDGEYVDSGDPTVVQKWVTPIYYSLDGDCTDEDLATIDKMADILNGIYGFPGFYPAEYADAANLRIRFRNQDQLMEEMGYVVNGDLSDGIVHFWYNGNNEMYDEDIGIRNDVDQYLRNSVILEEIYNGLGPVQDTTLRPDSLIYQYYAEPQELTDVDLLLLKLLYHPDMLCGMDAAACEQVIRSLYY